MEAEQEVSGLTASSSKNQRINRKWGTGSGTEL